MLRNIEERISRLDEIMVPEGEINLTRLIQQQKNIHLLNLKRWEIEKNVLALERKIYALKNLPQPEQNPLELIDFTAKAKALQPLLKDLEQTHLIKSFATELDLYIEIHGKCMEELKEINGSCQTTTKDAEIVASLVRNQPNPRSKMVLISLLNEKIIYDYIRKILNLSKILNEEKCFALFKQASGLTEIPKISFLLSLKTNTAVVETINSPPHPIHLDLILNNLIENNWSDRYAGIAKKGNPKFDLFFAYLKSKMCLEILFFTAVKLMESKSEYFKILHLRNQNTITLIETYNTLAFQAAKYLFIDDENFEAIANLSAWIGGLSEQMAHKIPPFYNPATVATKDILFDKEDAETYKNKMPLTKALVAENTAKLSEALLSECNKRTLRLYFLFSIAFRTKTNLPLDLILYIATFIHPDSYQAIENKYNAVKLKLHQQLITIKLTNTSCAFFQKNSAANEKAQKLLVECKKKKTTSELITFLDGQTKDEFYTELLASEHERLITVPCARSFNKN